MKINNVVIGLIILIIVIIIEIIVINRNTSRNQDDKKIINDVVDNFMMIAKIPRPSHHEEKISNYLVDWAKEHGLDVIRDSVNNVRIDAPATKGMENRPLVILQVHMDMVVAISDGKSFDPLNDPITVIRNDKEGTLSADGTSLGGDDGIGVAIVMAILEGKMEHGPLRVIITVDEEDGMTGAFNLDSSWLDDASYLINVDNEWSSEVLVSTAAGDTVHAEKKVSLIKPSGNTTVNISISNLNGGHSGVEIDKGRLNGLIGLANFLNLLNENNIYYEIASFDGGTAPNAIPAKANAKIVINEKDKTIVEEKMREYCDTLKTKYKNIEENIKCDVNIVNELPLVISKKESDNAIKFITKVVDGVYTMSKDMDGLVESSSNLGLFKIENGNISFTTMIRSSLGEKEKELLDSQIILAKECGFDASSKKGSDAWPYNPNSKLLELAKKVYKEQNNEDIKVSAVHAGLECGTFKKIKEDLDMISIGPDLKDGHTIRETIYLNSIPKVWNLLKGILKEIK